MAEEQQETQEENADGGSKKKLFIIIGAVVFLLIASGVAAFMLLGGDDEETAETEESAPQTEEIEEDRIASYYALPRKKEPGFVIMLQEGTRFKQAQVSVKLFTYSSLLKDYLTTNDPMMRHHIVNYLGTEPAKNFIDRAGREKMQEGLRNKLVEVIESSANEQDKLLGKKLEDVYFTQFVLQ